MRLLRSISVSRALIWMAAVLGVVHAGFSLFWALGGTWLLGTVGQWAVQLLQDSPVAAGIGLGAVAVVKVLAALIPVGVEYGRVPGRLFWRGVSWVGGVGLVVYGGVSSGVSSAVLAGWIHSEGGYNHDSMVGHAYLWDPVFFLWGCALVGSLSLARKRSAFARGTIAPSR